jgi:hypothetical protein
MNLVKRYVSSTYAIIGICLNSIFRILFINHGNSLCYEELCFANRVLETCVKFMIFCLCKVYHYF